MKKILIALSFFGYTAGAQTLSQDAEGKSTLVYYGGNIGFDLSKTRLSFTYSNLSTQKKNSFLWGVNAYGSNNSSLATIISGGELEPESGLDGLFGYRMRIDKVNNIVKRIDNKLQQLDQEMEKIMNKMSGLKEGTPAYKAEEAKLRVKQEKVAKLEAYKYKNQNDLIRRQLVFYARLGGSSKAFKLAKPNPSSGFGTIFEDEKFAGRTFSLGTNYETGPWLFGLQWSQDFSNNLTDLSTKTYTLTTAETVGNQTLVTKKDISAYSATSYKEYTQNNINFDAILFTRLEEQNFVAWNFYVRHKMTTNAAIVPTYTNLGLGGYFFNKENKFLGGIYVELPDVSQSLEKTKPEPEIRKIQDRLVFGIVARFNFSSIIGPNF